MIRKIWKKGRTNAIVLPPKILKRANIQCGDFLEISVLNNEIVLRPVVVCIKPRSADIGNVRAN